MIDAKSFYRPSAMAPTRRMKRRASPSPEHQESSVKSTTNSKRTKAGKGKTTLSVKDESSARRSPRISKKVSVSMKDVLKENVRSRRKTKEVKKEEEEMEEEENEMTDLKPFKEETDSDMSEDDEPMKGLSEYESRRLENISKNAEFFASLDIFKAKENLVALTPQAQTQKTRQTRGLKSQKRQAAPIERRAPSLRLQNKSPEGSALPAKFKEPPLLSLYQSTSSRDRERLSSEPIKMDATNVKKVEKTDAGAEFVESLAALARGTRNSVKVDDSDIDKFASRLSKMKMKETYVAKVVPERIFSVAVHSSVEKSIVIAGDKWGKIGFWDVNSTDGDDGVFLFAPHSRPVNCLRFAPNDPNKLYSVAYDGTVRCGDFTKAVFDQVYLADEDDIAWTNYFDFASSDGRSLLVTQNDRTGYVAVVDTRSRKRDAENVYWVHGKNVKTVSVHPTQSQYFVTASTDATAALWDIPSMKSSGSNKPIATMPHSKSVSSAFFSPITGGKILTTSLDDKISIFDTESAKEGKLTGVKRTMWQSHNNWTGRWLTVFRAAWIPNREDSFVVGSMSQPRTMEVLNSKGKTVHRYYDDHLGSVCSLIAFHPTRDMLVGGNSSGKMYVFMA